jgi:hypothetical protein
MSWHAVEWVQPRLLRRYKEQPPLSEAQVANQQRPRTGLLVMAGALGLAPTYKTRAGDASTPRPMSRKD